MNLYQITFNDECVTCFCDRAIIYSREYTGFKAAPRNLSDLKLYFQYHFYNSMTQCSLRCCKDLRAHRPRENQLLSLGPRRHSLSQNQKIRED